MSKLFQGHFVQFFDDNGDPLSGGEVTFYRPGTTEKKDVYTGADLATPETNPVTLDSAGRATVYLNGDYKVRLEDSAGVLIEEQDSINPPDVATVSGGNLVANGSFEDQVNSPSEADGWTLTPQNDGTVERITADNYDGEASLKFTSTGNGGGQADTDAFFPVSPGRVYVVSFALKCSVSDIRNIVQVRYFDKDQVFLSATSIYDEDTSNPTSWALQESIVTPPTNARFAKIRILGADKSDSTSGEAKFDDVLAWEGVTQTEFSDHSARHQAGGADEILHASQHEVGGSDEVSALPGGTTIGGASPLLDDNTGPFHYGYVNRDGSSQYLPSGWSSTKTGTGTYTITHNIGLSNPENCIIDFSSRDAITEFFEITSNSNSFSVAWKDSSLNSYDNDFTFTFINLE